MTRRLLAPLLLLAACGEPIRDEAPEAAPEPAPIPAAATARPALAPPAVATPPPADPNTPVSSPPAGEGAAAAGFTGRWATAAELCSSPFVLTPTQISTPGGVICRFPRAEPNAQGWTAEASCSAEGPSAPARLVIVREGEGLRISGAPFEPVRLRPCEPTKP